MEKLLVGAVLGIFVGAFMVEVLNRKKPGFTKNIEDKAKDAVEAFTDAYKDGYGKNEPEPEQA